MVLSEAFVTNLTSAMTTVSLKAETDALPSLAFSPESFKRFTLIISIALSPIVCSFGVFGNIVGLYILRKDRNKNKISIYTYLIALMVFNITFLLVGFGVTITEAISISQKQFGNLLRSYMLILSGYANVCLKQLISIMLIVMSLEHLLSLITHFTVKHTILSKYPLAIVLRLTCRSALCICSCHTGCLP